MLLDRRGPEPRARRPREPPPALESGDLDGEAPPDRARRASPSWRPSWPSRACASSASACPCSAGWTGSRTGRWKTTSGSGWRRRGRGARTSSRTGPSSASPCYSTGIPRLINIICDNALVVAYATSAKRVGADTVDEVATDLGLVPAPESAAPAPAARAEVAGRRPPPGPSRGRRPTSSAGAASGGRRAAAGACRARVGGAGGPGRGRRSDRAGRAPSDRTPLGHGRGDSRGLGARHAAAPVGGSPVGRAHSSPAPARDGPGRVARSRRRRPPRPCPRPATVPAPADRGDVPRRRRRRAVADRAARGSLSLPPRPVEAPRTPPSAPRAPPRRRGRSSSRAGATVADIALKAYGSYNLLAIDLIKELNPHIHNLNWIRAGEALQLPSLDAGTLIRQQADGSYNLIIGSFLSSQAGERIRDRVRRAGYQATLTTRRLTDNLEVHRVELTGLPTREVAQQAWNTARANCWLQIADTPCERTTHG